MLRNRIFVGITVLVGGWVLAIGGNVLTFHEQHPPSTWGDLSGFLWPPLIGTAVIFGLIGAWVLRPSAGNRAAGAALVLAIIAVLTSPGLVWTASTFVIGAGAAFLGLAGLDRAREQQGQRSALARAGLVLGGLAALANVALWVLITITGFNPGLPA